MSVGGDFFQFHQGELRALDLSLEDTLSVADSFLVTSGLVKGLERHFLRFANSIDDEKTKRQLPAFFSEVVKLIPKTDDWFPRLEYRAQQPEGERLFLRLRDAPERTETCTLWTSDELDPRQNPKIKGPDLAYGQRLRRAANLHGADEAVITDSEGFIADGALSSVVWWRSDVLCAPDDQTNWLPSVTRELIFELASQAGYQTLEVKAKPDDLAGCEVWTLSALQGIRGVTRWGSIALGPLTMLSPFRKRLALLAQPLPTPEAVMELNDLRSL
jgi:branched-subunit amino acid aminotransferase/4-amino-4-deoxychorismate lyase